MPHARDDDRTEHYIATTKLEAAELFKSFVDTLKGRKYRRDAEDTYGTPQLMLPYYLFVLLQPTFLEKSNPINDYLLRSRNLSAGIIMLADDVAQLPPECNIIVDISNGKGEVYSRENAAVKRRFMIDPCEPGSFEKFGAMLENVSCEAENQGGSLPKSFLLRDDGNNRCRAMGFGCTLGAVEHYQNHVHAHWNYREKGNS